MNHVDWGSQTPDTPGGECAGKKYCFHSLIPGGSVPEGMGRSVCGRRSSRVKALRSGREGSRRTETSTGGSSRSVPLVEPLAAGGAERGCPLLGEKATVREEPAAPSAQSMRFIQGSDSEGWLDWSR
ncbi:uncharacterized protein LOC144337205 [Macaca mulatta]